MLPPPIRIVRTVRVHNPIAFPMFFWLGWVILSSPRSHLLLYSFFLEYDAYLSGGIGIHTL